MSQENVKDDTMITHQLPSAGRLRGALSILALLGIMMLGPMMPGLCIAMILGGWPKCGLTLTLVLFTSMLFAQHSPRWCRFYLQAAGFFKKGVFIHIEQESLALMKANPSMWCMHPHGTSVGFGFTLNGAVRLRAENEATFLPKEFVDGMSLERLRRCNGVQAPVLFKIPLLRNALMWFGCSTPATKPKMMQLFKNNIDFGILPGGMEEVALYTKHRDRIFIKKRAGFIKYALQHGYLVQPAYTFGECDLYTSLVAGAAVRIWMVKNLGFIIPIFWGPYWWAPLLPNPDVAIHTVVGEAFKLPIIADPTREEVAFWHAKYMDAVTKIYNNHKARFGYADRQLELL